MRIAIDAHAIGNRLTGNERYIANLAEQLLSADRDNEYFLFFDREETSRRWTGRWSNVSTGVVSPSPWLRLGLDFPRQLRRLRADLFHYQYTGPLFRVCPEVATVHDVSFERHPEFYGTAQRLRLQLTVRRAARTARRIITVSEFSKAEMVHYLGTPEEKVKVIYNGVGPEFRPRADAKEIRKHLEPYSVRRPYLLAVGNVSRRKNHGAAVRGFALWLSRRPQSEHRLVIAGNLQDAAPDVLGEAVRLGLPADRLQVLGYVPESELPFLYAGADVLLNTSLYEGFGLPLAEAMGCGVPVIAGRASCFPEIAGGAARLVDTGDPEEMAQALEEVLENSGIRSEMIGRGLRRAAGFRWDVAARETLKVYDEAVQRP